MSDAITLEYVPLEAISVVRLSNASLKLKAKILADMFRLNSLYMIMHAGGGHIGTSFSAVDIMTWLWLHELTNPGATAPEGDSIFFSSKGHDVPALYALLLGFEKLPFELLHKFRSFNGLDGHPDVHLPFMISNTGSLGMGVSKARGMAKTDRLLGRTRQYYVLTGDGELQEGQIWESLQPTANQGYTNITVIVDHNKIQSDRLVDETSDLGDLEAKFTAFGWHVERVGGHDFDALEKVFNSLREISKPKVIIADTIKGQGVSFMEKLDSEGFYKFHAGKIDETLYVQAVSELTSRINEQLKVLGLRPLLLSSTTKAQKKSNAQKLIPDYEDELAKIGAEHENVVVLDADLIRSCGLITFQKKFPDRFIECGIAEQDMISMAGGLALMGRIPIAHSLACFLSPRPNEQMYNNATEKTKIVYVGTQAGLLPAGPGHSHQSVRDISCLGAIPGLILLQPCNAKETRMVIRWAVEKNTESTYLRVTTLPREIPFTLPDDYSLELGRGIVIREGADVVLISYGPVMLTESFHAAELLEKEGLTVRVVNLPWLNRIDHAWLKELVKDIPLVVTVDDHYVIQGQGERVAATLAQIGYSGRVALFGVEEIPACGQNDEVLAYHKLSRDALAKRIKQLTA